jgi:hypothetical protein
VQHAVEVGDLREIHQDVTVALGQESTQRLVESRGIACAAVETAFQPRRSPSDLMRAVLAPWGAPAACRRSFLQQRRPVEDDCNRCIAS